jgi:hypothetical protein
MSVNYLLTVGFEGEGWLHECAFRNVRPKCLPRSEKHLILRLATRVSACDEFHEALDRDGEELPSGLVTALDEFRAKPENLEVYIYIHIYAIRLMTPNVSFSRHRSAPSQMDVDIIPEYPIAESLLPGNQSFGAVVNIPLTKLTHTGR